MKKALLLIILLTTAGLLLLTTSNTALAQAGQLWETIVGNPQAEPIDDGSGSGGDGGGGTDENQPEGVFSPPFACKNTYGGSTYANSDGTHRWEIDFNRVNASRTSCPDDGGDPVFASAQGTVRYVDRQDYGLVIVSHSGGYETHYGHMKFIQVRTGDKVKHRQKLGSIGNTFPPSKGTIGNHLHYEQKRNGVNIKVRLDGKGHPASLDNTRTIGVCPGVGYVNCKILY